MTKTDDVSLTPKDIPTEIVRDFPGRFYVEPLELRRLAAEINQLLVVDKNGQKKAIKFWARLENGTLYSTDDLEIVLKDENENSKVNKTRIMVIVIIGELVDEEDRALRRIVVQFSRAKEGFSRTHSWEQIQDETFNLNYKRPRIIGLGIKIVNLQLQSLIN